jgi:GNAT superfamily N-acetyltransferase
MNEKSWWYSQPVFPHDNIPYWSTIDKIPEFSPHPTYGIYRLNIEFLEQVLDFINAHYLYGYRLYLDYFTRKINSPGALALLVMDANKIIGFIYSSPIKINGIECAYVDLMTVHKSYRGKGLAKVLISAITNYSNFKHYIHKKDKEQLPFPYFYKTRHYSGHIPTLFEKYNLGMDPNKSYPFIETNETNMDACSALYKNWLRLQSFKPEVPMDTFQSSETVKTYFNNDIGMFSFSIFEFKMGFFKTSKIAEVFFVSNHKFDYNVYVALIYHLHKLQVEYTVVQKNSFFKEVISSDFVFESMDLFLHSYNLNMPVLKNIQLPVM